MDLYKPYLRWLRHCCFHYPQNPMIVTLSTPCLYFLDSPPSTPLFRSHLRVESPTSRYGWWCFSVWFLWQCLRLRCLCLVNYYVRWAFGYLVLHQTQFYTVGYKNTHTATPCYCQTAVRYHTSMQGPLVQ